MTGVARPSPAARGRITPRALLACGLMSSALYVAMNAIIPLRWDGYSIMDQTVSELSAIGAPTRPLWLALVTVYTLLYAAFGLGVWLGAERSSKLRVVGALIVGHGVFGLFWPPMHLRGAPFTLTDGLHIAFAVVTLVLMALTMGYAAKGLGEAFRNYTAATMATFVLFGTLTAIDAPALAANLPTPWIGVWERINIGAFMLWVGVFAAMLLRRSESSPQLQSVQR